MPLYEYKCPECNKTFEMIRSLAERDDKVECPHCKTVKKMPRLASLTQAVKSPGSATSGGGSCGAPSGFS